MTRLRLNTDELATRALRDDERAGSTVLPTTSSELSGENDTGPNQGQLPTDEISRTGL